MASGVKRVSFFRPPVDVIEEPSEFRIIADVPGASAESVEIAFEQGTLVLTARVPPRGHEKGTTIAEEYGVGDYRRVFKVSDAIDAARAAAEFRDGVLTIRLPKTQSAQRRTIAVQGN